ncbi:MAG: hypothetical protein LC725_10340 [Lentisphaerae bacterium]|nr:hypothetical protein [Lentisphaerota bacterium]
MQQKDQSYKPDHVNYRDRIVSLRRHNADRMVGESTGWTMDARGDESLYKPSQLGRSSCSLRRVAAGVDQPFTLTFIAGPRGLGQGAQLLFWMPGQGSLGTMPQTVDQNLPGYVELETDSTARLETVCASGQHYDLTELPSNSALGRQEVFDVSNISLGFKVVAGELEDGATVKLHIGRKSGFVWKCLAGRKEFKVLIRPAPDAPAMRLPEPVRIDIDPLAADHLDVFLPGSAAPGTPIRAAVLVRDMHDNRVACQGPATLVVGDREYQTFLQQGRAELILAPMGTSLLQASASVPELGLSGQSNCCVPAEGLQLFFGDMHTHDMNSTAEGFPSDCYAWARDDKRLDFQSLPVQVHRWIDNEKWALVKHFNEYFLEEGRFVTFLAFEWQHSSCGDKVVHYLGGDQPYLPVDDQRYDNPGKLYAALKNSDAFIISHHPGYALDLHVPGTRWEVLDPALDRMVELWSMHGSSEGFDPLDRPVLPPRRPGGVYEAFMARRTYALTGARIALEFKVNGACMGAEIALADKREILIKAHAPGVIRELQLLRNTEIVHSTCPQDNDVELSWQESLAQPAFYHCRVIQADGHLAVSSPVWVG